VRNKTTTSIQKNRVSRYNNLLPEQQETDHQERRGVDGQPTTSTATRVKMFFVQFVLLPASQPAQLPAPPPPTPSPPRRPPPPRPLRAVPSATPAPYPGHHQAAGRRPRRPGGARHRGPAAAGVSFEVETIERVKPGGDGYGTPQRSAAPPPR
jgi:hypothetical protein